MPTCRAILALRTASATIASTVECRVAHPTPLSRRHWLDQREQSFTRIAAPTPAARLPHRRVAFACAWRDTSLHAAPPAMEQPPRLWSCNQAPAHNFSAMRPATPDTATALHGNPRPLP